MAQYLWLIPVGFLIGGFGTLIGAGGGFILVPLLLILYPKEDPEVITSISLAVVFFNALSGSLAYARMRRIEYRSGILFSALGIPGAVLGALTTYYVPRSLFNAVCGVVMLCAAIYLLWRPLRPREEALTDNGNGSPQKPEYNAYLGGLISVFVGYVSSLLGIGGGIIHVPALVNVLNFPVHVATATSHFILAVLALTGTGVHIASGAFHAGIRRTVCLAVGVVIGAQVGAMLSSRVKGSWIVRLLALALGVVAVRLIVR